MAGRGRGRGALLTKSVDSPPTVGLRKPRDDNKSNREDKDSEEIFIKLIAELRHLPAQSSEDYHKGVYSLVKKYATTKEKLEEVVKLIYDKSLGDRQLCKNGVALCNALCVFEVDSVSFRSELLKRVQIDFKDKDFNRIDNVERYISCAIFLCQMFLNMRTKTGELFRPLVTPIFEYLELLLSPEAQEVETVCCVRELTELGELMEHYDTAKMNSLWLSLRSKIIDEMSSTKTRLLLLQVLELRSNGWERLNPEADNFYKETLRDLS